jgi:pimeloyl-ACP methyl ester carboxylesterase/DNA-binding CsgD family transcriptional regulator
MDATSLAWHGWVLIRCTMDAAATPAQTIRYLRATHGVRLAWAESGRGPVLVKASNWLTHLEFDRGSPVWSHWLRFFGGHFRFVRYDERGCGMSDWSVGDLSVDQWVEDLSAVVEAARPQAPFALLGISQGAAICIAYAVAHPERVSHLLLYGGYAQGWMRSEDSPGMRQYRAMVELLRYGWGRDNPSFRQVFTSRFIPGGTREQLDWFNELCRKTATAENAVRLLQARSVVDVTHLLERVRTPTLVLHARDDEVIPLRRGRALAAAIPGAEFVELDSRNHVLLEHEPAWARFQQEVLRFTGREQAEALPQASGVEFTSLSVREREILAQLCEGWSNAQIAQRLYISEKTVRNHVSHVFDKLGVHTRAQAIVRAHEGHFHA